MQKIKPTSEADKLLNILANMFCLNLDYLKYVLPSNSTFKSININTKDKERFLIRLSHKFKIRINQAQMNTVDTIWDAVRYVVEHKDIYFLNPENKLIP